MQEVRAARSFDLDRRLDAFLGWVSASYRRAVLALIVLSLISLLPGFVSLPPSNRDESRFAQPAKQMVETGDYTRIYLQNQPRNRKPIGIYWLQAGTVRAAEFLGIENARSRIEIYRVPSLLAAIGAILLTYWTALAFVSRRYALLAGSAMAVSVAVGVEARLATIDESLLLTAVAALGAVARVYLRPEGQAASPARDWGLAALFWTAIAASILLKGPIVPMIALLATLTLVLTDRSARWLLALKPVAGAFWLIVLLSPWLVMTMLRSGEFFQESVGTDLLGRLLKPAEGHWGPPGTFWLLFWVTFWPAAALAPMATAFAWQHRREPALRLLIAWIVPGWVMFELIVTKLPHYVLPLYPAIAILIALALERRETPDRWTRATAALLPAISFILFAAVAIIALKFDGTFGPAFLPFGVLSVVTGAYAWSRVVAGQAERGIVLACASAVAIAVAVYSVLPRIEGLAVAPRLIAAAKKAPCVHPALAAAGHNEPNLVFLGGTDLKLLNDGSNAADFLRQGGCRVVFLERRQERAFAERAEKIGLLSARIGEVEGFDYSNWRRVHFLLLVPKEGS